MGQLLLRSLFVLSLFGFSVASLAGGTSEPPPQADLSTPEKALQSYWALKNWEHETLKTEVAKLRTAGFEVAAPYIAKVTAGAAQRYFAALKDQPSEILERHIDEISVAAGGQVVALVTIKNVTPIPADARPTQAQLQERARGRRFKYVLVVDGNDWKVSEVWRLGGPEPYMSDQMLFETLPSSFPSQVWYD